MIRPEYEPELLEAMEAEGKRHPLRETVSEEILEKAKETLKRKRPAPPVQRNIVSLPFRM